MNPRFQFIPLFPLTLGMAPVKVADHSEALFSNGEKNSATFSQITIKTASKQHFFPRFLRWMSSWGIETNGYVNGNYIRSLITMLHSFVFFIELLRFRLKRGLILDYTKSFLFGLLLMPIFWRMFHLKVFFMALLIFIRLGAGTVGPVFFGLGMRDSMLVVVVADFMWVTFFNSDMLTLNLILSSCFFPAYLYVCV